VSNLIPHIKKLSKKSRKGLSIFPISERGYEIARRLGAEFEGAVIFKPSELRRGGLARLTASAFKGGGSLVFICASGIAVRAIAPLLKRKELDPGVVVLDERGAFVVSLVSGHLGGANALARRIAACLGATPVITTATDAWGLPCIEDIIEGFGLAIEDARKIKMVNSAILRRVPVPVIDADPVRLKRMRGLKALNSSGAFSFLRSIPNRPGAAPLVVISSALALKMPAGLRRRTLVLRPPEFVVGMGCSRGASAAEIERLVKRVFREAGISVKSIRNLATIDIKSDEPGLLEFAARYGLGIEYFKAARLGRIKAPSGASALVKRATGTGAVSEPAALLSSKAKRLWVRKKKSKMATVAVARSRS
jgi:cobalt-precorrin 5A hydrolase